MGTVVTTTRLKTKVHKQITQLAEREGKSVSSVCSELIETAISERKEVLGISLIDSAINRVLSRHFKTLSDRLSRLLARTLIESMTNRSLTIQLLAHHIDEDTARAFNQMAYKNSITKSKKPVVALEEVLQNVAGKSDFITDEKDIDPNKT